MKRQFLAAENYCCSVRDGTHDTPVPTSSGFKLVTGKHIKNGVIDPYDAYYISEDDFNSINARSRVEKWDVLMSMIGTVGEAAVVADTPLYAIKNVALFKCGGSEIKGKWLAYYLRSEEAKGHMRGNMKGSSQQFLSLKQLRSLPIPIASEHEMKKIVNVLSAYDDLIENNRRQIKLLEEAAQRLYKEWFIDLRFPGHESTPIINGIPEGWVTGKAIDFFSITIGKTPPRAENQSFTDGNNGTPWVSISDMGSSGVYIFFTTEGLTADSINKYNVKKVPIGTILLSFKLTLGRVSIVTTPCCTNEAIAHFYIDEEWMREYTYLYLKNFEYDTLGNTSSISKAVNSSIIKAMPFILPNTDLVSAFSKLTVPIFKKIYDAQKNINAAQSARDKLLPQLMTGELEVIYD